VVEGGHELGHHSGRISRTPTRAATRRKADLVRANENIRKLTGRTARGYRSPSWDLSPHTIDLLIKPRLPLRLEPDGRRLHSVSGAARRHGRTRQALWLRRGDGA